MNLFQLINDKNTVFLTRIWKQAASCKSVMPAVIVKDFVRSFLRWNAAVPLKRATRHFWPISVIIAGRVIMPASMRHRMSLL